MADNLELKGESLWNRAKPIRRHAGRLATTALVAGAGAFGSLDAGPVSAETPTPPTKTATKTVTPTKTPEPTRTPTPDPKSEKIAGLQTQVAQREADDKKNQQIADLEKKLTPSPTKEPPKSPPPTATVEPTATDAERQRRQDDAFGKEKAKLETDDRKKNPQFYPSPVAPGTPGKTGNGGGKTNNEGGWPCGWILGLGGLAAVGAAGEGGRRYINRDPARRQRVADAVRAGRDRVVDLWNRRPGWLGGGGTPPAAPPAGPAAPGTP